MTPSDRIREALHRAEEEGPPRLEVLGERPTAPRSVGILPGSFDPMTNAHAALAEALRASGCDAVLLLYSPRTMPKDGPVEPPLLSPGLRLASVLDWASGSFEVAVCSHGLYVEQAGATASAFPGSEVVIGLGTDKLTQLFDPSWYPDPRGALEELFVRARVAYAVRAGDATAVDRVLERAGPWRDRLTRLEVPEDLAALSSSEVRRRYRRGEDVSGLVPAAVGRYLSAG